MSEYRENLGALIDLSQIKDGDELKRIIEDFDNIEFRLKKILKKEILTDLIDKSGDFSNLFKDYKSELEKLDERISTNYNYSEKTYVKKEDKISIDDFNDELKKQIMDLINASGNLDGYVTDYNGKSRKLQWTMYFTLYGTNMLYLGDIENKSYNSENTITVEDWSGENDDFSNSCVELWMYDNHAESYDVDISNFYVNVTGEYDSLEKYYYKASNGTFLNWSAYNASTWETDKENIYYFDKVSYENALIDYIEKNESSLNKTYVLKRSDYTGISETARADDTDRKEPCGKVRYEGDGEDTFYFDVTSSSRYIFKIVKYVL